MDFGLRNGECRRYVKRRCLRLFHPPFMTAKMPLHFRRLTKFVMANFKTHLQVATVSSGLASTLFLNAGYLSPADAMLCWLMGTLGGILPDIDSDNSHSLSILFSVFSIIACGVTAIAWAQHLPLMWVWVACAGMFVLMQFGVRNIFEAFTVHRGIFHSLLAGLFFVLVVASGMQMLGASSTTSWFLGLFTGFGYCVHLLLDEIFAVDFMNVQIKRSFGSAFKLFDYQNLKTSGALALAVVILFFLAPSYAEFLSIVFSQEALVRLVAGVF